MVGTKMMAVADLETTHWYEPFWKPLLDPLSTYRLLCWIPQESNQQDGNTDPPNIRQASHRSPEHNPTHQSEKTQFTHKYTRTSPSHQEAYISHLRQTHPPKGKGAEIRTTYCSLWNWNKIHRKLESMISHGPDERTRWNPKITTNSVQLLSYVWPYATPWNAACQASLSPTPRVHPNPCPMSWWCHWTISSSAVLFSFCLQAFPASGSFQMSQLFTSGGQSIAVSASTSVLPRNTQDWSPLGWTGWIALQTKELAKIFCNTTVQKHHFFGAQLSL